MNGLVRIFIRMAEIGLQAGTAAAIVLLCRQLFLKRQPARYICALWLLVFLRFLCPVTLEVPFSVPDMGNGIAKLRETVLADESRPETEEMNPAVQEEVWYQADIGGMNPTANEDDMEFAEEDMAVSPSSPGASAGEGGERNGGADSAAANRRGDSAGAGNAGFKTEIVKDTAAGKRSVWNRFVDAFSPGLVMRILSALWLGGVILVLAGTVVRYAGLQKKLRFAVKSDLNGQRIRETDQIASPFVMGIFKPVIYLPVNLSEQEREHIVAHEQAHIRRRDYLFKLLCFLGVSLHWLNPLAWIAFYFYNQDMEMACDECAIRSFNEKERLDYSRTLLLTAVRGNGLQLPVFFGESNTKKRVENIMKRKRTTILGVCLAAVLLCGLVVFLFTGKKNDGELSGQLTGKETIAGEEEKGDAAYVSSKADGLEAYPNVKNGKLNVTLYNFSRWKYRYVNPSDYAVEQKSGSGWIAIEPENETKRLAERSSLQIGDGYKKEISDLLTGYEKEMEDGEYRILLQCKDNPVEDPAVLPDELAVYFSWKDGQPAVTKEVQKQLAEAEERRQERSTERTYVYDQKMTEEEMAQFRCQKHENEARILSEEFAEYEEKTQKLEELKSGAAQELQASYDDFLEEIKAEQRYLFKKLDQEKYLAYSGAVESSEETLEKLDNLQSRRETLKKELEPVEESIAALEGQLDEVGREMELAKEGEKEPFIEKNNEIVEKLTELLQEQERLAQLLKETERESKRYEILNDKGYDLVERVQETLKSLPEELTAENAGNYCVQMFSGAGRDEEAKSALRSFWENTGNGAGSLPDTWELIPLQERVDFVQTQDGRISYDLTANTVSFMTLLLGSITDEGDMIVTSITAWGDGYIVMTDQSRDKWKGNGVEDISVEYYDHLNWTTSEDGKWVQVVASDRPDLTFAEVEKQLASSVMPQFDCRYIVFFSNE